MRWEEKPIKQELTRVTEASLKNFLGTLQRAKLSPASGKGQKGKSIFRSSSKKCTCYTEENSEWLPDQGTKGEH